MSFDLRILGLLVYLTAFSNAYAQREGVIEYRNAVWWDGRVENTGTRFVSGGQFVSVTRGSADTVIDLGGALVTAPFGEGHNHNLINAFFGDANDEYLGMGVFYVKVPGIHPPAVAPIRRLLGTDATVDAAFALGSITSPGGHPVPLFVDVLAKPLYGGATYADFAGQAFHEVETEADVVAAIETLGNLGTDFVKAILVYSEGFDESPQAGMDPSLLPVLVQQAHASNLEVTLHVESAEDFRVAVRAGVDEIAHLPGFIWPGSRTADEHRLTADDARKAAEAGVAVVATTHYENVLSEMLSISNERVAAFKEMQRHNLKLLIEAGVEIRIGSDVYDRLGNGLGANPTRGEIDNLVRLGVFDSTAVLSRWIDTGRRIFPDRRIGCFEVGCEASFLVFEADPRVDLENLDRMTLAIKQGIDVTRP